MKIFERIKYRHRTENGSHLLYINLNCYLFVYVGIVVSGEIYLFVYIRFVYIMVRCIVQWYLLM